MPKNKLAGKHPSYNKLKMSPKSIARKKAYDAKCAAKPKQIAYRTKLNAANRKAGTYGNGDGLDASHTKKGKIVMAKQSVNRAANGQGKRSKHHA